MALNFSRILCQRTISQQLLCRASQSQAIGTSTLSMMLRPISIKIVQPENDSKISFEERNALLKREMSPHLTIYKIQLTSMLSISHRMTGMVLAGYAASLGFGALVLPHDFASYITMIEGLHLSSTSLVILKFLLAYPLAFHTCNGIRHLSWDMGKFLKLNEVYTTGYAMLGSSLALSIFLAIL